MKIEKELLDLLLKIERKPELYVGNKSNERLFFFLMGYCTGKGNGYGKGLFDGFRSWLAERYDDNRSLNWLGLLEENEPDGKSTDAFFRLLYLYFENN